MLKSINPKLLGKQYFVGLSDDVWTYILQCIFIVEEKGLNPKCLEFREIVYDLIVDQLNDQYWKEGPDYDYCDSFRDHLIDAVGWLKHGIEEV